MQGRNAILRGMARKPPFSPAEAAILEATGIATTGPDCLIDVTCPHCGRRDQYAMPRAVADVLLVGERHRGYAAAAEYLNTVAVAAARLHAPECAVVN